MSVYQHLRNLRTGVDDWNRWRAENPEVTPDLSGYDFQNPLTRGHLTGGDPFDKYELGPSLRGANLACANLSRASLVGLSLTKTNFNGADLSNSNLTHTDLSESTFVGATLTGADLSYSILVGTDLTSANMNRCRVYGISAWDVVTVGTSQCDLAINLPTQPTIRVDNIEVAQFIYLLLNNQKIRHVIDTITSKVVLILGRFTPDRKAVLDSIRDELRKRDYLPVLFDFEKPSNRDITETVSTLAHMARFVIADLSDPKSIPHELAHVVPLLPSVPIMPLIVRPQKEYAMFEHFFGFHHVLKPFRYRDEPHLLSMLNDKVIGPAEKLAFRIAGKRG